MNQLQHKHPLKYAFVEVFSGRPLKKLPDSLQKGFYFAESEEIVRRLEYATIKKNFLKDLDQQISPTKTTKTPK